MLAFFHPEYYMLRTRERVFGFGKSARTQLDQRAWGALHVRYPARETAILVIMLHARLLGSRMNSNGPWSYSYEYV